jgi:hypothetical protein
VITRVARLAANALLLLAAALGAAPPSPSADMAPALPLGAVTTAHVGECELLALPGAERALANLDERSRVVFPRLQQDLGLAARAPFRMVLITAAPPKDTTLARLDADVPEWAAGYMLRRERLGVIRLDRANRYPYGTPESVFAHEVTHLMIGDAVGDRLPLWFEEGVATWAGRAWRLEDLRIVSARIISGDAPRLEDLEAGFHGTAGAAEESYAASFAFVRWSTNRFGDDVLRRVIDATRTRSFAAAWQSATGEPLERSEAAWRRASRWDYRWLPILSVTSPLWLGIMVLAAYVWLRRRARAQRLRETWELEPEPEWFEQVEGLQEPPEPEDSEPEGDSEERPRT